jgi:hypothetical protein
MRFITWALLSPVKSIRDCQCGLTTEGQYKKRESKKDNRSARFNKTFMEIVRQVIIPIVPRTFCEKIFIFMYLFLSPLPLK